MKNKKFQAIVLQVPELSHSQRVALKNEISTVTKKKTVCDLLEKRIEKHYQCVHCESPSIVKHGYRSGMTRYRCKSCGKTFNALTGTNLAKLRKKELWLDYSQCILDSLSVRKSAKQVQVNSKTAFRWRHRFLGTAHNMEPKVLSGVVEADETFFRKSQKGNRNLDRPPRQRGEPAPQRFVLKELVSVLVACDRNGHEVDYITGLGPVTCQWLNRNLSAHLASDTLLITEKCHSLKSFSMQQKLKQITITSKKGEKVDGFYHVQHVNAYHRKLKTWMQRFHGVATKYLNSYLGWSHELHSRHINNPLTILEWAVFLNTPSTGT
ncbi:MAG: IS1595 family transposase [Lentisphaeria bacterium]|nr:IS1595 family transposase [Lentisphaeria bacterium]